MSWDRVLTFVLHSVLFGQIHCTRIGNCYSKKSDSEFYNNIMITIFTFSSSHCFNPFTLNRLHVFAVFMFNLDRET